MKKIDFKSLEITNFLSIGKTQRFDFSDGISTIFGINRDKINDQNGSGKSSLLAAVSFALFGDPIKSIKREEVVNRIAGSKCVVKLEFDVEENGKKNEYTVERGVKPGYCKLIENGNDISLSGMPETTKKINDIIGTSVSMFKNTCLMTLEDSVPFAKQKAAEKREFIEGIFDLGFIKEMNKIAKEESAAVVAENAAACARISVLTEAVSRSKTDADDFEKNRKESIADRTASRNMKSEQLDKIKSDIDSLSGVEDQWNKVQSLVSAITNEKESLKKEKSDLGKERDSIITEGAKVKVFLESVETTNKNVTDKLNELRESAASKGIDDLDRFLAETKISELESMLTKYDEAHRKLVAAEADVKSKISQNNADIEKMNKLGNVCLACGRPFDEKDLNERDVSIRRIRNEVDALLNKIVEIEKKDKEILFRQNADSEKIRNYNKFYEAYSATKARVVDEDTINDNRNKIQSLRAKAIENGKKIKDVDERIADNEDKHSKVIGVIGKISEKRAQLKSSVARRDELVREITSIDDEISKMESAPNKFAEAASSYETELKAQETKRDETENKCNIYRVVKDILSDDGFRSYIIKQYISVLNNQINKYLVDLDAPVRLEFDEYLEDKIVDQLTGSVCSYDSLSGGEKRRVDIACLLAFSDLRRLRGDVLFSHSFYDEILDSALSAGACARLMDILKKRYDDLGESAMIITHKKEMQDDPNVTRKILVEKIGGVSKISDG